MRPFVKILWPLVIIVIIIVRLILTGFLGGLLRVDLIKWVSNVRPSVCPSVRPYVRLSVRPQKVSSISMKFGP